MMNKSRSIARPVIILLLLLVCGAGALGIWAVEGFPGLLNQKLGPPSPRLSVSQRVIYAFRLFSQEETLLTPLDPQGQPRHFTVSPGEPVKAISARLVEDHIIADGEAFRNYVIYAGLDTGIRAGTYQLSPAMNAVEIAYAFQNAISDEVQFNILAGWRAEEIAAVLLTSGLEVTPDEFLPLVNQPQAGLLPAGFPRLESIEGFLMPGEYQIKRAITAEGLATTFLKRFNTEVTPDLREAFTQHGLTLEQAVTLASIVQREAMVVNEQPTIASVFYNRLGQGMALESDPTVQYALGYDLNHHTWWTNPLTQDDLQVNSRYNTYIYPGLPPGPISNPGLDALKAVAYPAETGYFYFRAKCDGSGRHTFSVTYQEHLLNECP
jgi:UPF0755 protein